MIRHDTYLPDGRPRSTYQKAKDRKDELRADGWRVKIRKTADGLYLVLKKHRDLIDSRNHAAMRGCRQHGRKIPKWVFTDVNA